MLGQGFLIYFVQAANIDFKATDVQWAAVQRMGNEIFKKRRLVEQAAAAMDPTFQVMALYTTDAAPTCLKLSEVDKRLSRLYQNNFVRKCSMHPLCTGTRSTTSLMNGFVSNVCKFSLYCGVAGNMIKLRRAAAQVLEKKLDLRPGPPPPRSDYTNAAIALFWEEGESFNVNDARRKELVLDYFPCEWEDEDRWGHYTDYCTCGPNDGDCLKHGIKKVIPAIMHCLYAIWNRNKWNHQEKASEQIGKGTFCHGILPQAVSLMLNNPKKRKQKEDFQYSVDEEVVNPLPIVLPIKDEIIDEEKIQDWYVAHSKREKASKTYHESRQCAKDVATAHALFQAKRRATFTQLRYGSQEWEEAQKARAAAEKPRTYQIVAASVGETGTTQFMTDIGEFLRTSETSEKLVLYRATCGGTVASKGNLFVLASREISGFFGKNYLEEENYPVRAFATLALDRLTANHALIDVMAQPPCVLDRCTRRVRKDPEKLKRILKTCAKFIEIHNATVEYEHGATNKQIRTAQTKAKRLSRISANFYMRRRALRRSKLHIAADILNKRFGKNAFADIKNKSTTGVRLCEDNKKEKALDAQPAKKWNGWNAWQHIEGKIFCQRSNEMPWHALSRKQKEHYSMIARMMNISGYTGARMQTNEQHEAVMEQKKEFSDFDLKHSFEVYDPRSALDEKTRTKFMNSIVFLAGSIDCQGQVE